MPLLGDRLGLRRVYADRLGVGLLDDWSLVLPGLNLFVSLVCKDVRFRGNRRGHGSRLVSRLRQRRRRDGLRNRERAG